MIDPEHLVLLEQRLQLCVQHLETGPATIMRLNAWRRDQTRSWDCTAAAADTTSTSSDNTEASQLPPRQVMAKGLLDHDSSPASTIEHHSEISPAISEAASGKAAKGQGKAAK